MLNLFLEFMTVFALIASNYAKMLFRVTICTELTSPFKMYVLMSSLHTNPEVFLTRKLLVTFHIPVHLKMIHCYLFWSSVREFSD